METPPILTRTLLQKLGLKPDMRIAVLGFFDRKFMEDLPFEVNLSENTGYDSILFHAPQLEALKQVHTLFGYLNPKGALWIVHPKGVKTITTNQVLFSGNVKGFTDCKVCSFSESETARKFLRRRAEQR